MDLSELLVGIGMTAIWLGSLVLFLIGYLDVFEYYVLTLLFLIGIAILIRKEADDDS